MPRFVRPAWLEVSADGTSTSRGAGPRDRDGYLSAVLTLRTADGAVSEPIRLDAGGRFTDGAGRASLRIPREGFAVSVTLSDGTEVVYGADAVREVAIRPVQS